MLFLESRKPHLSPYPVRQLSQKKDTRPGLVIHSLAEPGKSLPPSLCLVGYNCTNAKIFKCGSLGWDTGGRGCTGSYCLRHVKNMGREWITVRLLLNTIHALERKNNRLRASIKFKM